MTYVKHKRIGYMLTATTPSIEEGMMTRRSKESTGELLSASQAAKILGVKRQQVYLLLKQDKLPKVEIGGFTLVPRAAVEQYLRTRRIGRPPKKKNS